MSRSFVSLAPTALSLALMLAAAPAALATGPGGVRKQIEASMLVTGTIQVDTAGNVTGHSLDRQEDLPQGVVAMLDKSVPDWKFEPVEIDGHAVNASARMSVRIVAKRGEGDSYLLSLRSASFGDAAKRFPEEQPVPHVGDQAGKVCQAGLTPPSYPTAAVRSGVASNVYLLLKVGPDGHVLDAMAEQVNLKVVADEGSMDRWRRLFARSALRQAAQWCLEPSVTPEDVQAGFFVARVPVHFMISAEPKYGEWEAYVPGPRQANPWRSADDGPSFSPDTLAPGNAYAVGSGLKLLTDLSRR